MVSPLLTVLCLVIIAMVLVMCCGICLLIKNLCRSKQVYSKIKAVRYKTNGCLSTASCSNETCAVCLEDFRIDENVNVCPCTHGYHIECLNNWLKVRSACPICQSELITAYGETTPLLRIYTIDV